MRVLLVADIHANLRALDAVLNHAGKVDAVWCLGDIVDLGAEPDACVRRLRELIAICVAGNHDRAAAGRLGPEFERAELLREASPWTRARLSRESVEWLAALPDRVERQGFVLIHDVAHLNEPGSHGPTRAPTAEDARTLDGKRALVGHFHLPFDSAAIVNPGPVGVPDWRPGTVTYAIVEDGGIERRVLGLDATPNEAELARLNPPPMLASYWRRQAGDAARARGVIERARKLLALSEHGVEPESRQNQLLRLAQADLAEVEGHARRALRLRDAVRRDVVAMRHPVIAFRLSQGLTPVERPIDVTEPSTSR